VDLEDFVFNLISLNKIASDDGGSIDAILFKYYNGFEPVVAKAMLYKALRNAVSAKNHLLAMSYLDKIWDLRLIDFKILIDNLNVSTLDERVYYLLLVMGEKENYSK